MTMLAAGLGFALDLAAWWLALVCLIVALGVTLGVRDVRLRAQGKPPIHGAWLVLLRVLGGVAIVVLALQPQWVEQHTVTSQGQIALLVDRSRSMTVTNNGVAREAQAEALVTRWLAENVPTRLYALGARLVPLRADGLRATDTLQDATSIGPAIEELARGFGSELGAVVVLSDGHETAQSTTPSDLTALGVKVHTVLVGQAQDPHDDAIVYAQAPAVAFVHQTSSVRVKVRAPSRGGQALQLVLRRDDEVAGEGLVQIDAQGSGEADLAFTPSRVGRELYRVEMATSASDPLPENNERALVVRVARDRTRVLLVSGRPGWDARYLRGLLNADPAVDLITFFILRTAHDLPMASPEEMSLIPFPTDELFREHLGSFDVVIFQDFEYGPYEMARYLPGIADYVKRGGSFAMIGGSQSFGAGGYAHTPIAEVLPVLLTDGYDVAEGAFRPVIARNAGEHPVVRLATDETRNTRLWETLSPMLGLHRFAALRAGAQVLLEHPSVRAADGSAAPVLAVGPAGQGRVLALGLDTSWRWGISSAASHGDASVYERFWSRALRYLTRDPLLEPALLDTDQERYAPSATMRVTGVMRDERYVPLLQQPVTLSVLDTDGRVVGGLEATTDHEGKVDASVPAPPTLGGYRIVAEAALAHAEQYIVVERGGPELSDVSAHPETLARLSAVTGGQHFATIDAAPSLAELDRSRTRIAGTRTSAPFRSTWFVSLAIGLFALEWWLRRRVGLR